MKYELETIPVWDAFKKECECPICILKDKAQETYLKFFLGNSVMVPEMRVNVNKTGFCPDHFSLLLQKRSPHYLGLMTHTHFKEYREKLNKKFSQINKLAVNASSKIKTPLKDKKLIESLKDLESFVNESDKKCLICDKIDYTMKRYIFTTVYLWKKNSEFRNYFKESKGFCLEHQNLISNMAAEYLNGVELGEFIKELLEVQDRNLKRLEEEILYFTQKFSQENDDKPWNGTKDAHYRLIQKITGKTTEH
ncbi:hypothetical protein EW093_02285 [Thiospirochaeta perfilievii]|uniref:ABC transporter substrate-binding protein n=1 Tax=Thiospirochaeta perfilievii TaxID=252967 RepID=A0A5C1Q680_9SPIO|nr:DUF6062 family protein [Thiospirochaeta perfilievii]QEN03573.1 hypothetical protein EW093_02285 [Thiospirochaeta perfilievii]